MGRQDKASPVSPTPTLLTVPTAFIINPAAGGGRVGRRLHDITRAVRDDGSSSRSILVTQGTGHARELAREVAAAHATVVAVGGDGTVSEVARGLVDSDSDARLGIIPLGTGNDLAHALRIPRGFKAAVAVLGQGSVLKIDYGKIRIVDGNGERESVFVNAVGAGLDAEIAGAVQGHKALPGYVGYGLAALRTVADWRSVPVRLSAIGADGVGRTWAGRCVLVTVGNGPRSGGGFHLTPDAVVSDGRLDVCIVKEASRRRVIAMLPLALTGRHVGAREVLTWRVVELEMEASETIAVHADGELLAQQAESVRISIVPEGMRVVAPPRL